MTTTTPLNFPPTAVKHVTYNATRKASVDTPVMTAPKAEHNVYHLCQIQVPEKICKYVQKYVAEVERLKWEDFVMERQRRGYFAELDEPLNPYRVALWK